MYERRQHEMYPAKNFLAQTVSDISKTLILFLKSYFNHIEILLVERWALRGQE